LAESARIRFSFLVNEADGAGRLGWLELTPGIGQTKAPIHFAEILLLPPDVEPQDMVTDVATDTMESTSDADGGGDSDMQPDIGPGVDASNDDTAVTDGAGDDGCGCRVRATRERDSSQSVAWPLLLLL